MHTTRLVNLQISTLVFWLIIPLVIIVLLFSPFNTYAQTSNYYGMVEFQDNCASCHENPNPAMRVPGRAELKALSAEKIYQSMTIGKMSVIAQGLNDETMIRISEWLSGRPIGDIDRSAEAMSNLCPSGTKLSNPLTGSNWAGWSPDQTTSARLQSSAAAGLNEVNVANLKLKWAFGLPGASSLRSQPVVGGGWLWLGSDNSMVYALDANTGCVHWSFETERPVISSISIGPMTDNPGRYALYFGDFGANVYALDAETGQQLWKTHVGDHHAAAVSGSVVLDHNLERLVVPIGSWEEVIGSSPNYECCTSRGGVAVLDVKTGDLIWKTFTLTEEARPLWKNNQGVQQFGPSGAAVWSAPTIDSRRNAVYVGTANSYVPVQDAGASDAIFAFDLDTGKLLWSRQLLEDDANNLNCDTSEDAQKYCDGTEMGPNDDVSAPPILHTLENGRQILIASQESRTITVLDPDREGAIIWQNIPSDIKTAVSGNLGPADDGELLYVPLAYGGLTGGNELKTSEFDETAGVVALYPETGKIAWTAVTPAPTDCPDPKSKTCTSANQAAATVIPGVLFTGSLDGTMRAYSTNDGSILWSYSTNRPFETINGIKANGGSLGGPGPTVVNGMVYWGSGYTILGTTPGNVLLAFSID